MWRMRKMGASDVGEYAEYLTGRVKDEAGYAAPASTRSSQGDYYLGTPGEPNAGGCGVAGARSASASAAPWRASSWSGSGRARTRSPATS